jgi:hypothetical protein
LRCAGARGCFFGSGCRAAPLGFSQVVVRDFSLRLEALYQPMISCVECTHCNRNMKVFESSSMSLWPIIQAPQSQGLPSWEFWTQSLSSVTCAFAAVHHSASSAASPNSYHSIGPSWLESEKISWHWSCFHGASSQIQSCFPCEGIASERFAGCYLR